MKAAIDIGTNTVLMLVGRMDRGKLTVVDEDHRAPRLGEGVGTNQNLSPDAMNRVITVVEEYKNYIGRNYSEVEDIYVTATSAVRDARNQSQFLYKIRKRTGLEVQILNGLQEAQYTYAGALSMLSKEIIPHKNAVIDIGGGSTEIAIGRKGRIIDCHSFDMGCVRFTERFLENDPLSGEQVEHCRRAIRRMLDNREFAITGQTGLIGVAGTVTSLAFIDCGMEEYRSDLLNGHTITMKQLKRYIAKFRKWRSKDLKEKYPVVMKDRADIFRAGLFILEEFMERYSFRQIMVSTGGIRHGAISLKTAE